MLPLQDPRPLNHDRPGLPLLRQALVLALCLVTGGQAQPVTVTPSALLRVPAPEVAGGRYWQQVRVELAVDDSPSAEALTVDLPVGLRIADTDGDGGVFDEVRVVYQAVDGELPRFQAATTTTATRIVVRNQERAAAGGVVYLQFPIVVTAAADSGTSYGGVHFADPRETDVAAADLPALSVVDATSFDAAGSMGIVDLAAPLAAGLDTTTSARGTVFPATPTRLVLALPDLVFDSGLGAPNRVVGHGDGDDANDTHFRFFFSRDALTVVNEDTATPARLADGDLYLATEGEGAGTVQLLTRDLAAGSYWLYVTADVTGALPLARSRVLVVRHEPVFERFGPSGSEPLVFDSGGLLDSLGVANGQGLRRLTVPLEVVDHDDSAVVHLFYSGDPNLGPADLTIAGETALLEGARAITVSAGLPEDTRRFDWDTRGPPLVPAGDYYLYAVAVGGGQSTMARTSRLLEVRHSPFLRLDAIRDDGQVGTVRTGGLQPQRFLTLTWGRSGSDGDDDVDDDATIDLYLSSHQDFDLPGGAAAVVAAAADPEADTHVIVTGLHENPDRRRDNQFVWDLWALAGTAAVPVAGRDYTVYGVIADTTTRRLVRMSGGVPGDPGSRLRFVHDPVVRPLQPVADLNVASGATARVSWQDMDLDDEARIRVVLSAEDHGEVADYGTVTAGLAFVVNSADGRAQPEVDPAFDLSEDSDVDAFDVGTAHLTRSMNGDSPPQPGTYVVYLAITDGDRFDGDTRAWRVQGRLNILSPGSSAPERVFRLRPEAFTIGNGGGLQSVDVRVDAGADTVDLVLLSLRLEGDRFSVADADTTTPGTQPFRVAAGFSPTNLVGNSAVVDATGALILTCEYFDPAPTGIAGLDGQHSVVRFDLIATGPEGEATIQLLADTAGGQPSQLELDGAVVRVGQAADLATLRVVPGRATLGGRVILEGRPERAARVEVSLRRAGAWVDVVDPVFAAANDAEATQEGVQVDLDGDGDFVLQEVPPGRWDLVVRHPGYLEGRAANLEVYPGAMLDGIRVSTTGVPQDTLLRGGDVAGYVDTAGVSRPDNEVTLADWDFVAALFGRQVTADADSARGDITGDGAVNIRDLSLVGANFRARGPRPVYRPARSTPAVVPLALEGVRRVASGDTLRLALTAPDASRVHAVQAELRFDRSAWRLLAGNASGAGLRTYRLLDTGVSSARVSLGGEGLGDGPLAVWRLLALGEDGPAPHLGQVVLLDRDHTLLEATLPSPSSPVDLLPQAFALEPNFPNPFNPATTIEFRLGAATAVRLEVFDAAGQRLVRLVDGVLSSGIHRVAWNGRDAAGRAAASGVYFARLQAGPRQVAVRPMLLLH